MIRVIHISDFHLSSEEPGYQKNQLIKAFVEDLATVVDSSTILAFTGDLIDKGGRYFNNKANAFYEFDKLFLEKVRIRYPSLPIFITPGNHDCDRSLTDEFQHIELKARLNSLTSLQDFIKYDSDKNVFFERIKIYKEFEKKAAPANSVSQFSLLESSHIVTINGEKIGIACLNSSWLCYDDTDRGNLLIGEEQIYRALEFINDCSVKIALVHHPLEFLKEFDRKRIKPILDKKFDLLLCGHVHEMDVNLTQSLTGSLLTSTATSTIADFPSERAFVNGYTIINLYPNDKINLQFKKYIEINNEFVNNTDIGTNDGCKTFYINSERKNDLFTFRNSEGQIEEVSISLLIQQISAEKQSRIIELEDVLSSYVNTQAYSDGQVTLLRKELRELLNDKAALQKQVNDLLQEFEGMDFSKVSSLQHHALQNLLTGNLNSALETLNDARLESELVKIESQQTGINKAKKTLAESYALKFKILRLKFRFDEAEANLKKALELDDTNPVYRVNQGMALADAGNFTEAYLWLKQSIEIELHQSSANSPQMGYLYVAIANILITLTEYEEASDFLEKASVIAQEYIDIDDLIVEVSSNLATLSNILNNQNDYVECSKTALKYAIIFNKSDDVVATLTNNLGVAFYSIDDNTNALIHFEKSLELQGKERASLEIGGNIFYNIGCAKSHLNQKEEALELMHEAVKIDKFLFGENNIRLAKYYNQIALEIYKNNIEEAKHYLEMSVKIQENYYHPSHPDLLHTYAEFGTIIQDYDPDLSIYYFLKAIENRIIKFGENDAYVGRWYIYLATSYGDKKDYKNRLLYLQKSYLIIQHFDPTSEIFKNICSPFRSLCIILSQHYINGDYLHDFIMGEWTGSYYYNLSDLREPRPFKIFISITENDVISGTCIDEAVENEISLISTIEGHTREFNIYFKKKYLAVGSDMIINDHSLVYEGRYSQQENGFYGIWKLEEYGLSPNSPTIQTSGLWKMRKDN